MKWISFLYMKNMTEFRDKRKCVTKGWNRLTFLFKPINIVGVVIEIQEDQEKAGKIRKILDTGTDNSSNPRSNDDDDDNGEANK